MHGSRRLPLDRILRFLVYWLVSVIPHLTSIEAENLLKRYGPNTLRETVSHPPLAIFLDQFKNVLVVLLMLAAVFSFFVGDALDGSLILAILILNALLGFAQEFKAEKALAALKRLTVGSVKVLRDGRTQAGPSTAIVPGDINFLEEGEKIPADAELLESIHLEADESALTGESLPVAKQVGQEGQIAMGTIVVSGRGTAKVTATGMQTKFGRIAEKLSEIKSEETPLEKKMAVLGKQLGIIALVAAALIAAIGLLRNDPLIESLLTAISLAVAAVPEGLPAVVTIALAVGTQRMARQKSILRKLAAIESLGGVTVIATDKTGTLTKNDMRVTDVWFSGKAGKPHDLKHSTSAVLSELVRIGVLCNNASLSKTFGSEQPGVIGDKTEGSLLLLARDLGIDHDEMRNQYDLVEEFSFSSQKKMMTVIRKDGKTVTVFTKGAPESVLASCTKYRNGTSSQTLTDSRRKDLESAFRSFARKGLRMIAFGKKEIVWRNQTRETVESDLTFYGFVGISDPPRPEIAKAVETSRRAGIDTIMITGDNELTAQAIAKEVGLLKPGDQVITGSQFEQLSDPDAAALLPKIRIVARATPEQKFRIVKLLQSGGQIVAVTGDGVNDALALKQADVGVAMGITGTDVAKEAADMIITDDNYASLVVAVEEGRTIFDNIKSTTKYLIGCNLGEIGSITLGVILGWPYILSPLQILYVNLVTDGLPAIGLALTPKQGDIMTRSPRKETQIFNNHDVLWFIEVGLLTTVAALVSFAVGSAQSVTLGRSLAFLAIILAQQYIFYDIAARNRTILKLSFRRFPWAILPVVIIIAQILLLEVPFFEHLFGVSAPPIEFSILSVAVTSALLVASESRKRFAGHLYSHH